MSFKRPDAEFYEALVSNTPDFIYAFDLQHNFTYANKALLAMWGRSWEESIGKSFIEIGYPDWHAEMHKREIDTVVATREQIRGVVPFDGTQGRRMYDYIFNPVMDPAGNVIAVAGTTRDVTEKHDAEETLRRDEARQRLALEASHAFGTWHWDISKNTVDSDVSFAEMFNISEERLRQHPPFEEYFNAVHPDDKARVKANIEACLQRGGAFEDEYRLVRPNGALRWISVRGHAQLDENGVAISFPGAGVDVTHQHEAVEALQASETRFRDLADAINQIIWVSRPDGRYEFINRRWYEFTGVAHGTPFTSAWREFFHPDDEPRASELWRRSINTGEPYEVEYRLRRRDGVYRWRLARAECTRDAAGNITRWYGSSTDIQDLVDAKQQAQAASVAKSEFLANMSHEIRTPMNAVIGLSDIMAMTSPLTERQRTYVDTLQVSAKSLLGLINDLLDIAKIEARTVEYERVDFNLLTLAEDVQAMTSVKAAEKNISFTLDYALGEKCDFVGDPTRIRQILFNLCANAVKFTEKGGVTLRLECCNERTGAAQQLCLIVCDTGIGIPAEKMASIFQKFTQADSSINRRYGGTGLGLAITKALVDGMGGTIAVESVPSGGSRFIVQLPLEGALAQVKGPLLMAPESAAHLGRRPRILLVEDYAPNVLVAQTLVQDFGYDCDVASSGLEALERVQANAYDVVLMDVQMPGMNGHEATRAIRAREENEHLPHLPIIGLTAHALAEDRDLCLAAGMDDYLSKPFRPGDLLEKLRKALAAAG